MTGTMTGTLAASLARALDAATVEMWYTAGTVPGADTPSRLVLTGDRVPRILAHLRSDPEVLAALAEALKRHIYTATIPEKPLCSCGWTAPIQQDRFVAQYVHADHVAAVLLDALLGPKP
jgi:hypothetical protein